MTLYWLYESFHINYVRTVTVKSKRTEKLDSAKKNLQELTQTPALFCRDRGIGMCLMLEDVTDARALLANYTHYRDITTWRSLATRQVKWPSVYVKGSYCECLFFEKSFAMRSLVLRFVLATEVCGFGTPSKRACTLYTSSVITKSYKVNTVN